MCIVAAASSPVAVSPQKEDLRALQGRLPQGMLEEFVQQRGGAWEYSDYRELVQRAREKIGEFNEGLFTDLLQEVQAQYLKRSKASSRRSKIEDEFAANLRRLKATGLLSEFVRTHKGPPD